MDYLNQLKNFVAQKASGVLHSQPIQQVEHAVGGFGNALQANVQNVIHQAPSATAPVTNFANNYFNQVRANQQHPFFNNTGNNPIQWLGKVAQDIKQRGPFEGLQDLSYPLLMNPYIEPIEEPIVGKLRVANFKSGEKNALINNLLGQTPEANTGKPYNWAGAVNSIKNAAGSAYQSYVQPQINQVAKTPIIPFLPQAGNIGQLVNLKDTSIPILGAMRQANMNNYKAGVASQPAFKTIDGRKIAQPDFLRYQQSSQGVNDLVGNMIGGGSNDFDAIAKQFASKLDKPTVALLGRFAEMVDKNPKQEMGQVGQQVQSLATQMFGKDAATLSNKQLRNAFDIVLGKVGQQANRAGLGLSVGDIRAGAKKGITDLKNNAINKDLNMGTDLNNPLAQETTSSVKQVKQNLQLKQPQLDTFPNSESTQPVLETSPQANNVESQLSQSTRMGQGKLSNTSNPSGSSISQVGKSENPYFNTPKYKISEPAKAKLNEVIQEVKPGIEGVVGKKLSNQEVIDTANNSTRVLHKATSRDETAQWTASLLRTRQKLADAAQSGTVTKDYLDTLLTVKTQATDIARKLQSFSINADPRAITAKQAILESVLKVESDTSKVLEAAKGVDFNDLNQATAFYRKFVAPTKSEWLDTLRYNSMLSSPNTHINNTFSNLSNTALVAPIEKTITGAVDFLHSAVTGKPRTALMGEGAAYTKGYVQNIGTAAHSFADVMRGKNLITNLDTKHLPVATTGLKGAVAKTLEVPTRLLEGMDQFFSTMTKGGVESSLKYRASKGIKVTNPEMQAGNEAAYRLFREELGNKEQGHLLHAIDTVANLVQNARNSDNTIVSNIAKFTLPFVRTPTNILKQMIEYSPAGVATLPGNSNMTQQLSKAILGSAVFAGAATLATSGRTTWAEPTDPKKKAAFRAAGMQPYAVKVGDHWVSYSKMPPAIAANLALVSALNDAQANNKLSDSQLDTVLSGVAKWGNFFADQSYVKNIGDLVSTAKGDPEKIAQYFSNYPQQLVPFRAMLGWIDHIVDPTQRKVDTNGSILQQQIQSLEMTIPGLSQNVPARPDNQGNPLVNQNAVLNNFSPVKITNDVPAKAQEYQQMVDKSRKTTLDNQMKKQLLKDSSSGVVTNDNKIIYNDNGTAKTINLTPPTKGTKGTIGSFSNTDFNASKAAEVWNSTAPQNVKDQALKTLGVSAQDARYAALTTYSSDVSTQYIESKSPDHQTLINNLLSGRVVSNTGNQFANNTVISNLYDKGLLSKDEATALKKIKTDSKGNSLVQAGTGKKAKKLPQLKFTKYPAIKLSKTTTTTFKAPTPKKQAIQQISFKTKAPVKKLKLKA